MRKFLVIATFIVCVSRIYAQTSIDSTIKNFAVWNERLNSLNCDDPEIVSLHFLFLQDILNEMRGAEVNFAASLAADTSKDFYSTKHRFDLLKRKASALYEVFYEKKSNVDKEFYLLAKEDLAFRDTTRAVYHLERALQYNPNNPEALLETAKISLEKGKYAECVNLVHQLYEHTELNDEQENAVSDFTLLLYDKLYSYGNNLVQNDRSAEALEVFSILEQFCNNMPSGYCNDDYYKGLMQSREGVYDSYISIAKEAEKRGNHEMARKFYKYADDYLRGNASSSGD